MNRGDSMKLIRADYHRTRVDDFPMPNSIKLVQNLKFELDPTSTGLKQKA